MWPRIRPKVRKIKRHQSDYGALELRNECDEQASMGLSSKSALHNYADLDHYRVNTSLVGIIFNITFQKHKKKF